MRAAQVTERTVALAEIVKDQPDAEGTKPFERGKRCGIVAKEDAFCDFQLEPARLQRTGGQRPEHRPCESGTGQLGSGDIDRDPHLAIPARSFGAGFANDPITDLVDQAGILDNRDELVWRNVAAPRMA